MDLKPGPEPLLVFVLISLLELGKGMGRNLSASVFQPGFRWFVPLFL